MEGYRRLNIIIAGEESGITRAAFAALGHNTWSCDLKPSRRQGQHYRGSWRDVRWESFDIGIMRPECTHLAVSGSRWFPEKRADGRQQAAIAEFMYLANAPVYASCVEQPVSIMSTLYRKPDQIVQPWMFGRWETKALCYWLRNLPLLVPLYRTRSEAREALGLPHDAKPEARVHRMTPSPRRAQERSESFPEVAAAMAVQWGGRILAERIAA
jgi:hypothetical protein